MHFGFEPLLRRHRIFRSSDTEDLSRFGSGPFSTVMSLISSRSMRWRSRAVVVDAVHNRGKSLASLIICCFWSAVIVRNVLRSKLASSASSSITRCMASFQRCSSVLAISRLARSTAS